MRRCVIRELKHYFYGGRSRWGGRCSLLLQLHCIRGHFIMDCWEKSCRSDKAKRLYTSPKFEESEPYTIHLPEFSNQSRETGTMPMEQKETLTRGTGKESGWLRSVH